MTPVAVAVPVQEAKPGAEELLGVAAADAEPRTEANLPASEEPEPTDQAVNDALTGDRSPVAPVRDIGDVEAVVEPAAHPADAERTSAAERGYVPRGEDRILQRRQTDVLPQRIEPTFEAAPASIAAEPLIADPTPPSRTSEFLRGPWTVRRVARLAGIAVAAYFGAILFLILLYRFVNPPTTTLIAYQWLTGTKIQQEWVPIEDISSNLLRAVVVSEDWGFCDHYGVDLAAIETALEQAGEGKVARGASTISMQVIKNLFLSQSKSYLRKAVEIPLTFVAEAVWPKARMLEIYLNIAEWGPGVFGAEAAAQHHFSKPASKLSQREAALLAAALPNPILRDAGDPGTRTARKASVIQSRMRAAGPVADCAMTGRQRSSEVKPDTGNTGPAGWQTTVKKRAGGTLGL
ncbi:MAG: monofunctional biosynthetic peptidoglycan transglycosylase [Hyphomicrobium sp.]|nr:monofunctional biosynthetic peptidoglycan transglycosylase [Hyphomicrobium sp.]